jgi:hypothetical protein
MDLESRTPARTRPELSKKKIYDRLQDQIYLPPRDSRGVTHAYLAQVDRREVFVVGRQEMARFLADLEPAQLKRTPHCCRFEAFFKLKVLLEERGLPRLGFDDDQVPDGSWLYSMLRFVDQENLSGVFTKRLREVVGETGRNSERLFLLQTRVGKELLAVNQLGKRREVQDSLEELWLAKRKATGRLAEIGAVSKYLQKLEKDSREARQDMLEALETATNVVYQAATGKTPDQAWQEQGEEKQRVHDALKLAYTVECVLRRDDEVGRLAGKFVDKSNQEGAKESGI